MWLVIAKNYLFSSHKKHFLSEGEDQIGQERNLIVYRG